MPYGARTIGTRRAPKRQRADVAADEADIRCETFDAASRRRRAHAQHRRRAIDADEVDAGARERQRDAAGAASELEHRPSASAATRRQNGTSRRPSVRAFSQS